MTSFMQLVTLLVSLLGRTVGQAEDSLIGLGATLDYATAMSTTFRATLGGAPPVPLIVHADIQKGLVKEVIVQVACTDTPCWRRADNLIRSLIAAKRGLPLGAILSPFRYYFRQGGAYVTLDAPVEINVGHSLSKYARIHDLPRCGAPQDPNAPRATSELDYIGGGLVWGSLEGFEDRVTPDPLKSESASSDADGGEEDPRPAEPPASPVRAPPVDAR